MTLGIPPELDIDRVFIPVDTTYHYIGLTDVFVTISTLPIHLVNGVAEVEAMITDPGKSSAGRCRSRPRICISSSPVPHARKNFPLRHQDGHINDLS